MLKKFAAIFSLTLAAGAALFAGGPVANAAGPGGVGAQALCPGGQVCVYQYPEFNGEYRFSYPVSSGSCWRISVDARSIVNNSYTVQRVWQHSDCTGQNMVIATNSFEIVPFTFRAVGGL
ncbi:peptidase inhibitor family I36 protein [Actinosynnema sp. NPDC059797]